MSFTEQEVRIEKNFVQGIECMEQGRGPRFMHSKRRKVFLNTDRPRPVNNIIIFLAWNLLKSNFWLTTDAVCAIAFIVGFVNDACIN